jgi:hypothetical protein
LKLAAIILNLSGFDIGAAAPRYAAQEPYASRMRVMRQPRETLMCRRGSRRRPSHFAVREFSA